MRIAVVSPDGTIGNALVEKAGAIPINCILTNYYSVETGILREKPDIVICVPKYTDPFVYEDGKLYEMIHGDVIIGTHNIGSILATARIPGIFVFPAHHMWRGGFLEKHAEDSKLTPAKSRFGMAMTGAEFIASQAGMRVIRTSGVFNRKLLQNKIISLSDGQKIYEPAFVTRSFIHVNHLVESIVLYIKLHYRGISKNLDYVDHLDKPKILNIAGAKSPSLYTFMREVAGQMGFDKSLVRPSFSEKSLVPRPWNGSLDVSAALKMGFPYVDYISGIKEMLDEG